MKTATLSEIINEPGCKFIFNGDVENKGIIKYMVVQSDTHQIVNLQTGEIYTVTKNTLLKPITPVVP